MQWRDNLHSCLGQLKNTFGIFQDYFATSSLYTTTSNAMVYIITRWQTRLDLQCFRPNWNLPWWTSWPGASNSLETASLVIWGMIIITNIKHKINFNMIYTLIQTQGITTYIVRGYVDVFCSICFCKPLSSFHTACDTGPVLSTSWTYRVIIFTGTP